MKQTEARTASRQQFVAAFAAIYLIWGSTYLAIRIAIETIPPFLMGGARFVVAGTLLYLWQRWKTGLNLPKANWRDAFLLGLLLIALGNGTVTFAEKKIPSGVTAVLIAGVPLWIALIDWLRPGGKRPAGMTFVGVVTGFAGVVLLVRAGGKTGGALHTPSVLALVLGSIAWSAGSVYSRQLPPARVPLLSVAAQMIAGGVILLIFSFVVGEPADFQWRELTWRSVAAFGYLVTFGALIGFSTYCWLLTVTTPTRVATYAYVNPVVAVLLGALLVQEPLTWPIITAASVILLGVAIISQAAWLRGVGRGRPRPPKPKRDDRAEQVTR